MITVVVLHDAALVRSALVHALGRETDIEVVGAGAVREAGSVLRERAPQVVLSGLEGESTGALRRALDRGGARLIVQVGADDGRLLADGLLGGACGVFSDRTGRAGVVQAVRHVAAGHGWVSPELVPVLVREYLPYHRRRAAARARLLDLGQGELRLLGLVAQGLSNAEIAAELHLAVSTVKDYVGALLGRLGATRSEAIAVGVLADLPVLPRTATGAVGG